MGSSCLRLRSGQYETSCLVRSFMGPGARKQIITSAGRKLSGNRVERAFLFALPGRAIDETVELESQTSFCF